MRADRLILQNIGPIRRADVQFGDLTVLVGPQATGKSIFLEFLKLLLDSGPIFRVLKKNGLGWDKSASTFLQVYLGEGVDSVWDPAQSGIQWRGRGVDLNRLVRSSPKKEEEACFFVPAQRVLALGRDGWLRAFTEYKAGDPFTVRESARRSVFWPRQRLLAMRRSIRSRAASKARSENCFPRMFSRDFASKWIGPALRRGWC